VAAATVLPATGVAR